MNGKTIIFQNKVTNGNIITNFMEKCLLKYLFSYILLGST